MASKATSFVYPLYHEQAITVKNENSVDVNTLWKKANAKSEKALENRTFFTGNEGESATVVAVGKAASSKAVDSVERKEALRKAVGTGFTKAKENGAEEINVVVEENEAHDAGQFLKISVGREWCSDSCWIPAVAAFLAMYNFTLKTKEQPLDPSVKPAFPHEKKTDPATLDWETGVIYAEAQNLARTVRRCLPFSKCEATVLIILVW